MEDLGLVDEGLTRCRCGRRAAHIGAMMPITMEPNHLGEASRTDGLEVERDPLGPALDAITPLGRT